jgi:hypothetical protein
MQAAGGSTAAARPVGKPTGCGAQLRVLYASRSTAPPRLWAEDAVQITRHAVRHNAGQGITGLLLAGNGHYVQLLEGPTAGVAPLYERIEGDPRHSAVERLIYTSGWPTDTFSEWSCVLLERNEPPALIERRSQRLRDQLLKDPELAIADLFKLLVLPSVHGKPVAREGRVRAVALASVSGLWDAAVIQGLASEHKVPIGRTRLAAPGQVHDRALVEYVDLPPTDQGPVRVLTIAKDVADWPAAAALVDRLDLLVLMVSLADLPHFEQRLRACARLLVQNSPRARLLVLSNTGVEPLAQTVQGVATETALAIDLLKCKLGQATSVWAAVERAMAQQCADTETAQPHSEDTPGASWRALLQAVLAVEGCLQAAVLRAEPLEVLAHTDRSQPEQLAGTAHWVALKLALLERLRADSALEEIDITTTHALELVRPLRGHPGVVLVAELDRKATTLAAMSMRLRDAEAAWAAGSSA